MRKVKTTTVPVKAMDVSQDGYVNVVDIIQTVNIILNQ